MQHHKPQLDDAFLTRREFLGRCGMGMGALSLATFFGGVQAQAESGGYVSPLTPKPSQFPARAKHVIHIFANGGPSHVDTFDPKPALEKYAGKPLPMENLKTERKTGAAFPSPYRRSEEHTSELQSRSDLVCRLLLEKKNARRPRLPDVCHAS